MGCQVPNVFILSFFSLILLLFLWIFTAIHCLPNSIKEASLMAKFIVESLHTMMLFLYWIMILFCAIAGGSYFNGLPGAILGIICGFIIATLSCGSIFVLIEINENLREIISQNNR